ncbi:MAG TPA: aminoglycoside phosphotransferase [Candidatus Binatia bacterium]|nr:aminoglycoside phosphotransferase [Candidatus Binatia bacterium]
MSVSSDPSPLSLDRFGIAEATDAIRAWLLRVRWFGGKERRVARIDLDDVGVMREERPTVLYTLWRVAYEGGESELYSAPLGIRPAPHPVSELGADHLVATVARGRSTLLVYDALADPEAAAELWRMLADRRRLATARGTLVCVALRELDVAAGDPPRLLGVEQSNSALVRGQRDFLKWSRRLEPGATRELEMAEALGARHFPHIPELRGHISYRRPGELPGLQAILQAYLENGAEGWAMALTSLRDLYAVAEDAGHASARQRHELVEEQGGSFQAEASRLGELTAELHVALADPALPGDMTPARAGPAELDRWASTMTRELDRLLGSGNPAVAPLTDKRAIVAARFDALRRLHDGGVTIRDHGDYHLGQVLRTDEGWKIIDFGGEPSRDAEERRDRASPLRDVAGMLRSFDYAAAAALAERIRPTDPLWDPLLASGNAWAKANREAFWAAYLGRIGGSGLLPDEGATVVILRAFELSKAVYEVVYELGHRPDWVSIPLGFLVAGTP